MHDDEGWTLWTKVKITLSAGCSKTEKLCTKTEKKFTQIGFGHTVGDGGGAAIHSNLQRRRCGGQIVLKLVLRAAREKSETLMSLRTKGGHVLHSWDRPSGVPLILPHI